MESLKVLPCLFYLKPSVRGHLVPQCVARELEGITLLGSHCKCVDGIQLIFLFFPPGGEQ